MQNSKLWRLIDRKRSISFFFAFCRGRRLDDPLTEEVNYVSQRLTYRFPKGNIANQGFISRPRHIASPKVTKVGKIQIIHGRIY